MPRFRKKPVEIEASIIRYPMRILTKEGRLNATPNNVLITGVEGEHYPCERAIFIKTYEPVDSAAEVMMDVLKKMEEITNASTNNKDNARPEEREVPRLNAGRSEGESNEQEESGSSEENN